MSAAVSSYARNRRYSPLSERLAEIVCRDGELREVSTPTRAGAAPSMVDAYQYDLSRWPVLVDDAFVGRFRALIDGFQPVVHKVLQAAFRRDASSTARYLSMPETIAELFGECTEDPSALFLRYDIVLSDDRIRIVEVNAGSTIGGWQHDWLHGDIRAALDRNAEVSSWNLKYRPVTESMFYTIADAIVRARGADAPCNILMFGYTDEGIRTYGVGLQGALDHALARLGSGMRGTLVYADRLEELRFDDDARLLCRGEVMDAAILVMPEDRPLPPHIYMRLASSAIAGKLVMPDAPHQILIGNKLILALLHEPEAQAALTPEEVAFIRAYVPWSTTVGTRTAVARDGTPMPMDEMLMRDRNDLVIKKAFSLQGRHVVVGRYTDEEQWRRAIEHAIEEGDWLAQEYCKPDTFVSWCPIGHETEFELVWGVFEMGRRYGGAFVRGLPVQNARGVINSASGAREFTVFERPALRTMIL